MPAGPAAGRGSGDSVVCRQEQGGEVNRAGVRDGPEQSHEGPGKENREIILKVTQSCRAREALRAQTRSPAPGYSQTLRAGRPRSERERVSEPGPGRRMRRSPSSAPGPLPSPPSSRRVWGGGGGGGAVTSGRWGSSCDRRSWSGGAAAESGGRDSE